MTLHINMEIIATIGIFAGLQLINVILNSLRSLIMAKSDSQHASAIINAACFGFYALIVHRIAHLPLEITIPATVITNIVGIYITYLIFRKCKKDTLWKIEIWAPTPEHYAAIVGICKLNSIPIRQDTETFLTVFSSTCKESAILKTEILSHGEHAPIKYNITEITKKF